MKPLNVRGKLRIGFIAKHTIEPGEELFWNYGFDRKNGELHSWFTGKPNPQAESTSPPPSIIPPASDSTTQQQHSGTSSVVPRPSRSKPHGRREVTCMVPGCGQRVKIWNQQTLTIRSIGRQMYGSTLSMGAHSLQSSELTGFCE